MRQIYELVFRYLIIAISGSGNLSLFYFIFTPLTFFSCYWIFSIFGETFLLGNIILFNGSAINLVEACIAGSAYFLLFILILSTADIPLFKRLKVLIFSFMSLLFLNIVRICIMGLLIGTKYFSLVHLFFWYFLSIVFVVLIWFSAVKIFKIKSIPVYSDLKLIIKFIKKKNVK